MISFSVAVDPNNGIGINGSLPWHIKDELKLFKTNTMNKNIIMGKTTYEGLPSKLEGRIISVVTSNSNYINSDVLIINDLESFLKQHENDETEYIVCGGASIYKQAYPYAKKAYVSFIKKEYVVDTKFESFNINDWNIIENVDYELFTYKLLERK